MSCVNREELHKFLQGKLDPARLLEVDEHIIHCAKCKDELFRMPHLMKVGAGMGADLLGVNDCPEYEELSSYVDGTITVENVKTIQAHINFCELCARDIARIESIRAQAELREKTVVQPGASRKKYQRVPVWKRAIAGASLAGVVAAAVLSFNLFTSSPDVSITAEKQTQVANNNPIAVSENTAEGLVNVKPEDAASDPSIVAMAPGVHTNKPNTTIENVKPSVPKHEVVLKDGGYVVIRKDDKLHMAKASGDEIKSGLSAVISEKLRTGKIDPAETVKLAVASVRVRSGDDAPSIAPKLSEPVGKIILSQSPRFIWSDVELADSYHLRITEEDGSLVYDTTTSENALTVTEKLERGKIYRWQVGVRFSESEPWTYSNAGAFQVLSAENYKAIEDIKKQLPGSHLALAAAYEYYGLKDEAADEYRALRRNNPDSKLAKELLYKAVEAGD